MVEDREKVNNCLKNRLLAYLAVNLVLSSNSINLIATNKSEYYYIRRVLSAAQKEKLVRKEVYKSTSHNGSTTNYLYFITKKGMRTLVDSSYSDWAAYIDKAELEESTLHGSNNLGIEQIKKIARINDAKFMAASAGGKITIRNEDINEEGNSQLKPYSDEVQKVQEEKDEQPKSFSRIIREAIQKSSNEQFELSEEEKLPDDIIEYTTPNIAKRKWLDTNSTSLDLKDFDRCSFDGIIESKKRFLMMYTSYEVGKSWKTWIIGQDLKVAAIWNIKNTKYRNPISTTQMENFEGMILVKNNIHFAQIYRASQNKESVGAGYKNFYVVPMTPEGVDHLRFLMLADFDQYDEKIKAIMIDNGYIENKEFQVNLFPFVTPNGKYVLNGTYLDLRRIQEADLIFKANGKQEKYIPEILCFEWQAPFYENIVNTSNLIII